MYSRVEPNILGVATNAPGAERRSWGVRSAWEPILRLAVRSLSGHAGWIRVGEEVRVISLAGELPVYIGAWVETVSRAAADADYLDETTGDVRAVAVPLGASESYEGGSIGVLIGPGDGGCDLERREILADAADALGCELSLLRASETSDAAVQALMVLSRAVTNMQLGVTITDADGNIVFTNPAEAAMHGYQQGELIGKPARILAPPSLTRPLDPIPGRPANGDTSWTRESVNKHRDGRLFPVLLWSDVIDNEKGGFKGVVTCCEDLTIRRRTEAALRRSESMFLTIFENAAVGFALLGHDSWIIRANPVLSAILGIDGAPTSEHRLTDFIHPQDADSARLAYANAFSAQGQVSRIEHRIGTERSDFTWIHVTISPISDSAGRQPLWIALIENTTERRALEEQLRHSQKMEAVGRLAGGVAHDFNNLLTAIKGITELLLLESGADHPMAADLDEIHGAAQSAADLTRQLLAFSRRQLTHYQIQNLNTIISDSERMLRRLVGDDVDLSFELAADLAPVLADQGQIEQVILNLLVNARDATPDGGTIRLVTRNVEAPVHSGEDDTGSFVELAVHDSGSGIDPRHLPQIFDPFFTTKEKGRGTGLGLSTVYGIVKQGRGHIHVDTTLGQGTTFRTWFPRADLEAEILRDARFAPIRTIMVLLDGDLPRALFAETLQDAGFRVVTAESAAEAVRLGETYGDRIHLLLAGERFGGARATRIASELKALREDMAVLILRDGPDATSGTDHLDDGADTMPSIEAECGPELLLEAIRRQLEEEGKVP